MQCIANFKIFDDHTRRRLKHNKDHLLQATRITLSRFKIQVYFHLRKRWKSAMGKKIEMMLLHQQVILKHHYEINEKKKKHRCTTHVKKKRKKNIILSY